MTTLRLGSRGSRLALTQTQHVAETLRAAHPDLDVQVTIIQTTGDKILDSPLSRIGGKGLFTKEIEEALLDGRIDAAVHSLKDLPTEQPAGLALGAITKRESPSDLLLAAQRLDWKTLGSDSRIGTSSLRRRAQIRLYNKEVKIVELRGNVPTRIKKMLDGEYDAIILAAAGVRRLGLDVPYSEEIRDMLPAPGQGALGLQIRQDDNATRAILAPMHDPEAAACCNAERALLQALGGGCQLPLGARGEVRNGRLKLSGIVTALDGTRHCRGEVEGAISDAEALGYTLSEQLNAKGAAEILRALKPIAEGGFEEAVIRSEHMERKSLGGKLVIITRDEDTDGPLSQALREYGAHPLVLPLVRHLPPADPKPLQRALSSLNQYDWIVFTSSRAVEAVRDQLRLRDEDLGAFTGKIACVGHPTARSVEAAGGAVELVPEDSQAAGLLETMTLAGLRAKRVLYPRADIAHSGLTEGLRAAGAQVDDVIAYRTEKLQAAGAVVEAFRARRPDAVLFCSTSSVEAVQESLEATELTEFFSGIVLGSIGPRTTEAMEAIGLAPHFEPKERSFEALAKGLADYFA